MGARLNRRLLAVALAAVLAGWATPTVADSAAGNYTISFGPDLPIWDATGSISETVDIDGGEFQIDLDIAMDARGRLTGSGSATLSDPDVMIDFSEIGLKGSIRSSRNVARFTMNMKLSGVASVGGLSLPVRGGLQMKAEIEDGWAVGTARISIRAKGAGSARETIPLSLELVDDPDDDGSWTLDLTVVDVDGKRLVGFASAALSNPASAPVLFDVKGNYNERRDESKLGLKGERRTAKGASIRLDKLLSEGGVLTAGQIRYKLLGQSGRAVLVGGVPAPAGR
jgi:hypothetical protein